MENKSPLSRQKRKSPPPFTKEHLENLRKARKKWKHSRTTIEKIRLSNLGQKRPSISGENAYQWKGGSSKFPKCESCGKQLASYKAKKCRQCNDSLLTGENSVLWKGGKMKDYPEVERIRKSIEYRLWREAVFARDNWTCQKTKIKGGELVAHHIQNFNQYPELRLAIDNGMTLSKEIHIEFHKKYGKQNNTGEQLQEFLINIE